MNDPLEMMSHLPTALAIDEAMLDFVEKQKPLHDALWFWELDHHAIVLGRSSQHERELSDDEILNDERSNRHASNIPIGRRSSGGASVVAGPGCLMYSVGLSLESHPDLRSIDQAHQFVMQRILAATQRQQPSVERQGICDLTFDGRKFSGNALKYTRNVLLYHGTLLYGFDLELLSRVLAFAPRQPEYRDGRDHRSFVTNLEIDPHRWIADVQEEFEISAVVGSQTADPQRVEELVAARYANDDWTYRH